MFSPVIFHPSGSRKSKSSRDGPAAHGQGTVYHSHAHTRAAGLPLHAAGIQLMVRDVQFETTIGYIEFDLIATLHQSKRAAQGRLRRHV